MKTQKCACGAQAREITTDLELFDGDVVIRNVKALYCPECKEELFSSEQAADISKKYEQLLPGFEAFTVKKRVSKVGNSLSLPLPKELADFMNISKGSEMRISVKNRRRLVLDVA
ncbi:MAG: YgiT-type zinc finger protein [Candidatus Altiarchaeota archaeon]|nr:YgiT-type zinc finger protein [Candidatus Altiarchaeota archaeon]